MKLARIAFRTKLLLIIGLAITLTESVLLGVEVSGIEQRVNQELNSQAEAAARQGAKSLATAVWELNRDQAAQILAGLALNPDFVSAVVTDQSDSEFVRFGSTTRRATTDIAATAAILLEDVGEPRPIGRLSITLSRDRIFAQQRAAIAKSAYNATIDIAMVFLAAFIGIYLITRPMEAIIAAMLRVAKGDTDQQTPYIGRRDQLGALAMAVEAFRGEISRRKGVEEELRATHAKLESRVSERTAELRVLNSALLESEEMARGIVDTALDAFIQMDEAGKVVNWNRQAEAIFGWSREEAVGNLLADMIIPENYRTRHGEGLVQFLRNGDSSVLGKRFEIDARRRDGREIKVELAVTALRRRSGYLFNGFIRDITEKIAAEEQLRHAQKMEAVGQLTGGIAHDFNNMLTVITGTIEILGDAVADKPQLTEIAGLISQAADRGAELTSRLLAFARKQPLQPQEVDINALMIEAAKLMRPTLGEHIDIEPTLENDIGLVHVDPNQLTSALLNLAINARDAMPNGGKLALVTSTIEIDESDCESDSELESGNYVVVAVSDSGTGIPEAIRDRIFEPFFSTKETGKGTGLGLSMVYGFVKQSGGHIKVYSEEAHGTTFRIYLPQAGDTQAAQQAGPVSASLMEGRSETILVVEDDPLVRSFVRTQLQSLGYRTISAVNAAEALAIINGGAAFDLLFTDLIMPGQMDGRQLADETAKLRPGLKVLFTSGYTEDAIVHHGRLDPGILLLAKPYRKSDLARMLRIALDSDSALPPLENIQLRRAN